MAPAATFPSVCRRLAIPLLCVALPLGAGGPGTPRWTRFDPGQSWIGTAVAPDGRIVAAANPASGSGSGKLLYLGSDGSLLHDLPSPHAWIHPPMLRADGATVAMRDDRLLQVFDANGDVSWARFFRGNFAAPVAMPDLGIAIATEAVDPSPRRLWILTPSGDNGSVTDLDPVDTGTPADPLNVLRSGDGIFVVPSSRGIFSRVDVAGKWMRLNVAGNAGSGGGVAPAPDLGIYATGAAGLARITSDGRTLWSIAVSNFVTAPLVTPDGLVLVGQSGGGLRVYAADGTPAWAIDVAGGVESTPVIASDGTIVFGGNDGHLRAVGPKGSPLWDFDAGAPIQGPINLLPNGDVLAGTIDGHLHCVVGGAPLATSGWAKWQGDAANSGLDQTPATIPPAESNVTTTDQASVGIAWNPAPGARRHEIWRSTTNVFAGATRVTTDAALPFYDRSFAPGQTNYYWVRAVNGFGAAPESEVSAILPTRRLWKSQPLSFLSGIAEMSDGRLVASGNDTSNVSTVIAINTDGSTSWKWSAPDKSSYPTPPLIDDDGNVAIGSGTFLVTLTPDGTPVSSVDTKSAEGGQIALGSEGIVYCAAGPNFNQYNLRTVNRTAGTYAPALASTGNGAVPADVALAILPNGNSILSVGPFIDAIAPAGIREWKASPFGRTLLPGNRVLLVGRTNAVIVDKDGSPVRQVSMPPVRPARPFGTPGLYQAWNAGVVAADGTTWFSTGQDIVRMAPDGTTSAFASLPSFGVLQSMGLGSGGRLVVGRPNRIDVFGADGGLAESLFDAFGPSDYGSPPLLLSPSGRLYAASEFGTINCISMPFGLDTTAFWPLFRRDPRGTSSIAKPVATPPPAVARPFAVGFPGGNRLRWTISGQLVVQEILRGTNADPAQATVIATLGPSVAQFDDTNAPAGPAARYWIRTSNSVGGTLTPGIVDVFPTPALRVRIPTADPYFHNGVALDDDGQVFVSNAGNRLQSWHPDGTAAWELKYAGSADFTGTPTLLPGDGLVVSNPSSSVGAARDGSVVGLRQPRSLITVLPRGRAVYRDADGSSHVYEGETRGPDLPLPDGGVLFPVAAADGGLFALTSAWEVVRLDATGHEQWRCALVRLSTNFLPAPDMAIGIDGSLAVVTASSGITMLNVDGTVRWARPEEGLDPVLGIDGALLVRFADPDGHPRLHALDAATGATRWAFALSDANAPAIAVADGTVVAATQTIAWGLDGTSGEPRWAIDLKAASDHTSVGVISTTRLAPSGVLAVQKWGGDLHVFQLAAGPAASGWPMTRHDSGNTGFQGSGGDVAAAWQRVAPGAGNPGELRFATESGQRFVPLVSDDLVAWRYLEQPAWTDETFSGPHGPATRSLLHVKSEGAVPGRFVRAVKP